MHIVGRTWNSVIHALEIFCAYVFDVKLLNLNSLQLMNTETNLILDLNCLYSSRLRY